MTRSNTHPHLAVEKLWKTSVVDPQAHAGLRAGGPADFTTLGPECIHSNGGRAKKTSERARTSIAFLPSPGHTSPGFDVD